MNNTEYKLFAKDCYESLVLLQERFREDYKIGSYENWFYSQLTGLLTFSSGTEEINFRYTDIGSFSTKAKTWKWSWDNDTTLKRVKENVRVIQNFGEKNQLPRFTTGIFESDEYEAWEFAAVAARLLGATSIYRPVNDDDLHLYFAVHDFVDRETAQKLKDQITSCAQHHMQRMAFVCQHLNTKNKTGFVEAFESEEGMDLDPDDSFQAWCDVCEAERLKEGEWNDRSMAFAQIKLVCEKCYFEMKEFNQGNLK